MTIFRKKSFNEKKRSNRKITSEKKKTSITIFSYLKNLKKKNKGHNLETEKSELQPEEIKKKALPWVLSVARLLGMIVSIALLFFLGRAIYQYATTAEYFNLQYIEIRGNQRLSNAQIIEQAELKIGENIFSVKLLEIRNKIRTMPWVLDANVVQKLPATVSIEVIERIPELLVLFDVPYFVDATGEIFKRWTNEDPIPDVILTGISRVDVNEDFEGVEQSVLDAIALKYRYMSSKASSFAALNEIHREFDGGFSLTVGKNPIYIRLGIGPYVEKIDRLSLLFSKVSKDGKSPLIIYMDNPRRPDRVTIKFKENSE